MKAIQKSLEDHGYIAIRSEALKDISASQLVYGLGHVLSTTDVHIDPEMGGLLSTSHEMPFHTDHPDATYILWQCMVEGALNECTTLIDTRPVVSLLNAQTQKILASIQVSYPIGLLGEGYASRSLLSDLDYSVYFCPWYLTNLTPEQSAAVDMFYGQLMDQKVIHVHLKKDEILLLDNRRILHGRTILSQESPRHLKRFWIAT